MNKDEISRLINPSFKIEKNQLKGDFDDLCVAFMESPRHTILEIGTYSGCTLSSFITLQCEQNVINPLVISIDNATYPITRTADEYIKLINNNLISVGTDISNLRILVQDSHTKECEDILVSVLNGRKLDFVFIDGDHSYKGVKQDYELCLKYMNSNSIMSFHDICCRDDNPNIGVRNFWNEIKGNHKYKDCLSDVLQPTTPKHWSGGIGVLYL